MKSKYRTETITVAVDMVIEFDASKPGAMQHAIDCAVSGLPYELCGGHVEHGCYSVKRGDRRLMPNIGSQTQPPKTNQL